MRAFKWDLILKGAAIGFAIAERLYTEAKRRDALARGKDDEPLGEQILLPKELKKDLHSMDE